jgi:hypothetical protein
MEIKNAKSAPIVHTLQVLESTRQITRKFHTQGILERMRPVGEVTVQVTMRTELSHDAKRFDDNSYISASEDCNKKLSNK